MEIHLKDSKGVDFFIPVNPEQITIQRERGIETLNILSLGEFDTFNGEKVKQITFSSFFPKVYDSGYCKYQNIPDPVVAMSQLTDFMIRKSSVQMIITGTGVNVPVIISAHTSTFRGGEPGDIYYELVARTWREPKVHTQVTLSSSAPAAKAKTTSRPNTKSVPKTYTVKSGDSLSKIAKLELGNSSKWQAIYDQNKKLVGPDPNKIKPGMKLVMPT